MWFLASTKDECQMKDLKKSTRRVGMKRQLPIELKK